MSSLLSANANNPFGRMHADLLERTPESPEETEKIIAELKDRGNRAFKAKRPEEAVLLYSRAIELDGSDHTFWSNRSAAYLAKGDADGAFKDAEECIKVKPDWAKGYVRKGAALHKAARYEDAMEAYEAGLKISPDDAGLKSGLEAVKKALLSLVEIRASQLNGCAFCVDMHIKEATLQGERPLRLHHVAIWRESPLFSDRERAALAWTEAVTRLSPEGVPDAIYEEAREHFSERELVDLTYMVMVINAWNRASIAFRSVPGSADKAFGLDRAGLA